MSCDVGEVMERLENEQSFTSPTSQLILQPFRRFTIVIIIRIFWWMEHLHFNEQMYFNGGH